MTNQPFLRLLCLTLCICLILPACQKQYSPGPVPGQNPATGSLHDSSGNCLAQTVAGTFYNGVTPGADTAYVQVQVNVTSPGSYAIVTTAQNGYYFADSGRFTDTGITAIKLKPFGTPLTTGTNNFSVTFNATTCNFAVTVKDSTGTGLGGNHTGPSTESTWEFATDSGGYFKGNITSITLLPDSVYWNVLVPPSVTGGKILHVLGYTAVGDSALNLFILFPGDAIVPGTYPTQYVGTDTLGKALFAFGILNADNSIYDALPDRTSPAVNVDITVSYDAATKIVSGAFSGTAHNEFYDDKNIGILNGKFSGKLQ